MYKLSKYSVIFLRMLVFSRAIQIHDRANVSATKYFLTVVGLLFCLFNEIVLKAFADAETVVFENSKISFHLSLSSNSTRRQHTRLQFLDALYHYARQPSDYSHYHGIPGTQGC